MLEAGEQRPPQFITLLCSVFQRKASSLGENKAVGGSELSATCEVSAPKEKL